jgi:hypothetical protein
MIASGWLNFCRCCALTLGGKSQVGIMIPICTFVRGSYNALLYHFCTTPYICVLVLAGMQPVYLVGSLL